MSKRVVKIAILIVAVLALISIHLYITFFTPASREGGARTVYIQKGAGFRMVAENLEKAGVVRDAESFIYAARLLGAYKKVQAGEYELDRSMTPLEILGALTKGKVKRHFVTIPEGYNIREVAAALANEGLVDPAEFLARATNRDFVATQGLEGLTFEGYLFPDTYSFTKGMTADEIIAVMADKFKTVYTAEFEKAARDQGMTTRAVVTLASIIEKETAAPEERDLISAVFHNRLKKGIRLQSDPTVIYDIAEFNGNLTKKNLLAKTPYNTYVNYGLPPGPISNPGKASINAAIHPAQANYLYFVSRNNGTHQFSSNLHEHNRAVNSYQRSRSGTRTAPPNPSPKG